MDPNANLKRQLELARDILSIWERAGQEGLNAIQAEQVGEFANRLAELVQALNDWIARGGSLPKAWQAKHIPLRQRKSLGRVDL